MSSYQAPETEQKWQARWRESGLFKANLDSPKEKYYNLTMFPYPSGDKLHVGHWYNYGPVDTWGRYMKMKGYEVFQPMGFDSFGLPAENYAIKTGVHPAETTRSNIDKMKQQIAAIGGMYDMDLDLETSSPEYYKWTQWVFLQLYKNGLAYRKEAPVNWCTGCQTVLANEQVQDGHCERCKSEVMQKDLTQWFFKITDYADKLLDYEGLDWPSKTVAMQKHWIGRSEGCDVSWKVKGHDLVLDTFTTTVDTIYGTTFVVISPEHPELFNITTDEHAMTVKDYVTQAKRKNERERMVETDKTGVFTGAIVVNPVTGEEVPLWVADYVLMSYGTGVVMGVPAHDQRDMDFANKYELPIIQVIQSDKGETFVYDDVDKYNVKGELIDSGDYTGMPIIEARKKITDDLAAADNGKAKIQYRLKDWLISRQRYWGAPIPIVYCEHCGEVPVPEDQLPVVHPHVEDYVPKGKSPLANAADFVNVDCPKCGEAAKREVDTMDTFVCSSWYFLRYPDAMNADQPWSQERVNTWMPVDMYIGGPEHACMHLLYARFVHRALHDLGHVDAKEPFKRLVHQGMVTKDGAKMSKSRGNVVSPDDFVTEYGSDVFRMYLMFMGPFTDGGDWNDRGIMGVARFVDRFYRMMQTEGTGEGMDKTVHHTVHRASEAIERMNFNIAIAALMELTNAGLKTPLNAEQKALITRVLAPLAPHLAEEIWEMLGNTESVFLQPWPEADTSLLVEDTVTYAVQVNGKLRGTLELAKDTDKDAALEAARALENVAKYLEGDIKKEIFVPGKIIGFVVA